MLNYEGLNCDILKLVKYHCFDAHVAVNINRVLHWPVCGVCAIHRQTSGLLTNSTLQVSLDFILSHIFHEFYLDFKAVYVILADWELFWH